MPVLLHNRPLSFPPQALNALGRLVELSKNICFYIKSRLARPRGKQNPGTLSKELLPRALYVARSIAVFGEEKVGEERLHPPNMGMLGKLGHLSWRHENMANSCESCTTTESRKLEQFS